MIGVLSGIHVGVVGIVLVLDSIGNGSVVLVLGSVRDDGIVSGICVDRVVVVKGVWDIRSTACCAY